MKTSIKLLLSAFVILIIAIGIYNNALKAEYLTGNYKTPYRNYNKVDIKDFKEIELNGASLMDVDIKQGDFAVYKAKGNEDSVSFTSVGNKLVVNVNTKGHVIKDTDKVAGVIRVRPDEIRLSRITIICPKLSAITTSNAFSENGKPVKDPDPKVNPKAVYIGSFKAGEVPPVWGKGTKTMVSSYGGVNDSFYSDLPRLTLEGFKLDSLNIVANGSQKVALFNTIIKNLNITAGAFTSIFIGREQILSANLQIKAGAQLVAKNTAIPNLVYHISDSARVSLSGSSLKSFIKPQ